jgi:hypothetical protein
VKADCLSLGAWPVASSLCPQGQSPRWLAQLAKHPAFPLKTLCQVLRGRAVGTGPSEAPSPQDEPHLLALWPQAGSFSVSVFCHVGAEKIGTHRARSWQAPLYAALPAIVPLPSSPPLYLLTHSVSSQSVVSMPPAAASPWSLLVMRIQQEWWLPPVIPAT